MHSVQFLIVAVCVLLLSSCGSSTSSSSPEAATPQNSDESLVVISLGRESVSPFEPNMDAPISYVGPNTNDITVEQIDRAGDFTFEEFAAAYDLVELENPGLSASSNEFGLLIIDLLSLANTNRSNDVSTRMSNIDTALSEEFNKLTDGEKLLIATNPIDGARTFLTVRHAREFSTTLFAGSFQSLEDGRGDAFRHSYWNWLMSECCGILWAEAFGTAHEIIPGQTPDFYKLRMDLNNNKVGRDVYSANTSASRAEAQQALLTHDLEFVDHTIEAINYDFSRLVYVTPRQSMVIFDDGPAFDDVFEISANGQDWGSTPRGGSKTVVIRRASSGEHNLSIKCLVDGTTFGCGFQFTFLGATILSNGMQSTNDQILVEESETYTDTLTFPTIDVEKELD